MLNSFIHSFIHPSILLNTHLEQIYTRHRPFEPDDDLSASDLLASLRYGVTIQEQNDQHDPAVDEETLHAPARDGYALALRVFRPAKTFVKARTISSPLIVLFHGGGFVLGAPVMMAPLARELVKRFSAVVVAASYRLAPEFPFPCSIHDGWDVVRWVAENASTTLGVDSKGEGFVIGGISAGGHVSNVIAHLARDGGSEMGITGVWMSCPSVRIARKDEARFNKGEYEGRNLSRTQKECVDSPTVPAWMAKVMSESFAADEDSELYAPMFWPGEGHKGMPRTYAQVCGMDTGRDELMIYLDMLKGEGVPTRLTLWPGLPHVFWHSYRDLPQSKGWLQCTLDGFEWLLKSEGEE
ncbi:hypothetical protein ES702_02641 [subsurface metagenome]